MPYRVRSRDCEKSDGTSGNAVLQKRENGSWVQVGCFDDKQNAEIVKSRLEAEENA